MAGNNDCLHIETAFFQFDNGIRGGDADLYLAGSVPDKGNFDANGVAGAFWKGETPQPVRDDVFFCPQVVDYGQFKRLPGSLVEDPPGDGILCVGKSANANRKE